MTNASVKEEITERINNSVKLSQSVRDIWKWELTSWPDMANMNIQPMTSTRRPLTFVIFKLILGSKGTELNWLMIESNGALCQQSMNLRFLEE
jgi:hypothetical protein